MGAKLRVDIKCNFFPLMLNLIEITAKLIDGRNVAIGQANQGVNYEKKKELIRKKLLIKTKIKMGMDI